MKEKVYTRILTDSNLQAKLMLAFKKSYSTIRKWALDKNDMLTTHKAQTIINEHINTGKYNEFLNIVIPILEEKKTETISQ